MEKSERNKKLYCLFQRLGGLYPAKGTIFLSKLQKTGVPKKIPEILQEKRENIYARKVFRIFPESEPPEEVRNVIEARQKDGYDGAVKEIVRFLLTPYRSEKILKILRDNSRRRYLDCEILHIAVNTAEPKRTEELANLLEECMDKFWENDALYIADVLLMIYKK